VKGEELLVAWIFFPLVLSVLALGCGLLLEQAAGFRLHGALLIPSGVGVIVVAAGLATMNGATAQFATPAVAGLAVAGLALSLPRRRWKLDRWAAGSALGVFAAYAAPVVLSGRATFAGYIKLDDTATWLSLADRVMTHGHSLAGLAPSTYEATLDNYLAKGYPVGSFMPLGVGRTLVGGDLAWLFQPTIAFLAATMGLAFFALAEPLIESPRRRALVVWVAAQPALLYGYALWGGIKEVAAAAVLPLVAALVPPLVTERVNARSLLPLAVATAAAVGELSVGGSVWLAPLLIPALLVAVRLRGRAFVRPAAALAALVVALSLPSLVTAGVFLRSSGALTSQKELGNLIHPLSRLQIFGIWPTADFRFSPGNAAATYILIAVLVIASLVGLAWAWKRRGWGLLLYAAGVTLGCAIVGSRGSPWVDAKALATASPVFLLLGLVGCARVFEGGRRIEAAVAAAAITGGVLWSNALAYHEVWLAPRAQLAELEQIGQRFAGEGPTLMTEYQPYGVRHFLRDADPEGASELRRRRVPLSDGRLLRKAAFADVDAFQLDGLLVYRTLVLRRSPVASRPPSAFHLVWKRRYYEVWQQDALPGPRIVSHLSLGTGLQPAATAPCQDVLRLAAQVRGSGRLAAVVRTPAIVIELSQTVHPADWQSGANPAVLLPRAGSIEAGVQVSTAGRYGVWIGGSFRRRLEVLVDGRSVGAHRDQLNNDGQYTPLGDAVLSPGVHRVTLRYGGADLRPGSGGPPFPLGPLVLSRATADRPVTYVDPANARTLCGKSLDWVEALAS
jgi:hypothetical protein